MNYCSTCGARVRLRIPPGDTLPRFVCEGCDTIHYQNPKMVVGCIPEWGEQILLCRRAIEPRHGLWTIPAGFMENDETTQKAAARETMEEAKALVDISSLFAVFSIPAVSQVYLIFRGTMQTQEFGVGEESLEVRLFNQQEIPWNDLAFQVIHEVLKRYCEDSNRGQFQVHVGTVGSHRLHHS